MKRQCLILAATFILAGSGVSWSAEISGNVTRQDSGTPIIYASINLSDENNNFFRYLGPVNPDGSYHFSDIEQGNYFLEARPFSPSDNDDFRYIPEHRQVTVGDASNQFDFALQRGGNISGVVATSEIVSNASSYPINVGILTSDWQTIGGGHIDTMSPGPENVFPYTSQAVSPGEYYVTFTDRDNQFFQQWYDNIPATGPFWDLILPVTVVQDETTTEINASLYTMVEAASRYWFGFSYFDTIHQNEAGITSTFVLVGSEVIRQSNSLPIASSEFASFTVTPLNSEPLCTESTFATTPLLRFMAHDQGDGNAPGDGIITEDEYQGLRPLILGEGFCVYGNSPHAGGTYQLAMTFLNGGNGGMPLTKSIDVLAGLSLAQLPTPTNLVAMWDDVTNQLQLDWAMPVYDPQYTRYLHVRINPYNKGQYLQNQVRVVNLPATIDTFTLPADLTVLFNHSGVDQLLIEVRVFGINNTMSKLLQSYNFSATTGGELVPAAIAPPPYDIDGDGQTGLAESIGILRDLAGP